METRQPESSDRSQRSTTTTTTLSPNHTNAILNPQSISQPSLLPRSTASTSTSERSSYFFILLATSLWVWISQNRLAVLGAGITFAGFVIGLAALVPAFAGQDMSQEALELARWTAMKDFIEQCWERKATGPVSEDCEDAMAASLPPPPHMDFDKKMDKLVGRMSDAVIPELRYEHEHVIARHTFGVIQLSACIGMYVVLLLAWLYVQETFRRLRWRWSLSVPRRAYVSYDGMADEEIGEFSYDYVELRPEPIRPSTIADSLQSRTLEELAHARLPDVSTEDETSHMKNIEGNVATDSAASLAVGSVARSLGAGLRTSRSYPDEDSDGDWVDEAARRAEQSREADEWPLPAPKEMSSYSGDVTSMYSPTFVFDSPQRAKSEKSLKAQRRRSYLEYDPRAREELGDAKKRLSARLEPRSDDAASMRRRQNMAAQRNRRASIVSDKSTGSVARVRRDEYATSSSNAFGALEGLEELSDEDGLDTYRILDLGTRRTSLWREGM